jgi:predicted permease
MILYTFKQLLPIILLTAGGFTLGRIYELSTDTLVKVIADFFMPLLIFHALYTSDISGALVLDLAGATTFVVALLAVAAFAYAKAFGVDPRSFMPAILFMNSGFLGIPLMKLWGGMPAMNLIVIFDQVQTFYIFTLGIIIITGGFNAKSLAAVAGSPILWAIFAGFAFRFLSIPVPEPLVTTLEFGGNAAPPLAAFTLGVSLMGSRLKIDKHVIAGITIRIVGGYLFGLLAAYVFGLTGLARTVVIVASSLPSAVFTSVLPVRYGVNADYASTIVVLTTLLGVITIPLAFLLAA